MTSNDNVNTTELKLLLENHFNRTEKQISEIQRDNAEFRLQMNKDFQVFTEKVEGRLEKFDARLDYIQGEIHQINNRVTGLEHDVSNLQTWNYWTLSIILALSAMPHIISGVKSLFAVISEGMTGIMNVFRKGDEKG